MIRRSWKGGAVRVAETANSSLMLCPSMVAFTLTSSYADLRVYILHSWSVLWNTTGCRSLDRITLIFPQVSGGHRDAEIPRPLTNAFSQLAKSVQPRMSTSVVKSRNFNTGTADPLHKYLTITGPF